MRIPINTIDGISRTIYAHYSSAGWSDFIPMEGGNPIPHTAVLEIMEVDKTICLNSKVNGKQPSLEDRIYDINGIVAAVIPSYRYKEARIIQIGNIAKQKRFTNPEVGRVYSTEGLSPTSACNAKVLDVNGICPTLLDHKGAEPAVLVRQGELIQDRIYIKEATQKGYAECPAGGVFDASYPESRTRRGRVLENGEIVSTIMSNEPEQCLYEGMIIGYMQKNCLKEGQIPMIIQRGHGFNPGGILDGDTCPSITTSSWESNNMLVESCDIILARYRIRKLTERECLRLMGVKDSDIDKIKEAGISKSRQYKMAGNSIVVDVLVEIFREMFCPSEDNSTLF